ncbi:MAG: hypothetical protein ACRD0L_16125 [Acidimicrobiales bacterium]
MNMRPRLPTSRRELLGYWPMVLVTLAVLAMTAFTVAFNLGG